MQDFLSEGRPTKCIVSQGRKKEGKTLGGRRKNLKGVFKQRKILDKEATEMDLIHM